MCFQIVSLPHISRSNRCGLDFLFPKVLLVLFLTSNLAQTDPPPTPPPSLQPAVLPDWGGDKPDTETHWPPHGFDICREIDLRAELAEEKPPAVPRGAAEDRWRNMAGVLFRRSWVINKSHYSAKWKALIFIAAEFMLHRNRQKI